MCTALEVRPLEGEVEPEPEPEPMSNASRTYASPSSAVEVKVTGPLGLRGSRLDSGVFCHWVVHARRAFLQLIS